MMLNLRGNPVAKLDGTRLLWLTACAICFSLYVLFAWRRGGFSNDDLDNFRLVQALDLRQLMSTPIDVHWVPLHRWLSWLVYTISPMNYDVAVVVMATAHLAGAVFLYRTLLVLVDRAVARAFVLCYLSSVLIAFGMMWWASAQHRMTYVCLDILFICSYMLWLRDGSGRYLGLCALAMLLALGFYEKAVLMPFHAFVLTLVISTPAGLRQLIRRLLPAAILGVFGLFYVAMYLSENGASNPPSVSQSLMAVLLSLRTQASGATALLFDPAYGGGLLSNRVRGWLIALLLLVLVVWTSVRSKKNALLWLGLLVVLFVDFLPSAISGRVSDFGLGYFEYYRFQYEEFHLVILFAAVALHWATSSGGVVAAEVETGSRRSARMLGGALVFAALNLMALNQAARVNNDLTFFAQSHAYMRNLMHSTRPLRGLGASFEVGPVPNYISIFGSIKDTKALVPLFLPDAHFEVGDYKVDELGNAVPVDPAR